MDSPSSEFGQLTLEEIRAVLESLPAPGINYLIVAHKFRVSLSTVYAIANGLAGPITEALQNEATRVLQIPLSYSTREVLANLRADRKAPHVHSGEQGSHFGSEADSLIPRTPQASFEDSQLSPREDAATIQKLIDDAVSSGKTEVFIPGGTYNIDTTITVPSLRVYSDGTAMLVRGPALPSGQGVFDIQGPGATLENFTIDRRGSREIPSTDPRDIDGSTSCK